MSPEPKIHDAATVEAALIITKGESTDSARKTLRAVRELEDAYGDTAHRILREHIAGLEAKVRELEAKLAPFTATIEVGPTIQASDGWVDMSHLQINPSDRILVIKNGHANRQLSEVDEEKL